MPLLRMSAVAELELYHHVQTSTRGILGVQLYLFDAMMVAPTDVFRRARLYKVDEYFYIWDVTPLMELITDLDIGVMLYDDGALVLAWWSAQLALPATQRPTGLTADLCTPRGRAELVTNRSLRLRALGESGCNWRSIYGKGSETVPGNRM